MTFTNTFLSFSNSNVFVTTISFSCYEISSRLHVYRFLSSSFQGYIQTVLICVQDYCVKILVRCIIYTLILSHLWRATTMSSFTKQNFIATQIYCAHSNGTHVNPVCLNQCVKTILASELHPLNVEPCSISLLKIHLMATYDGVTKRTWFWGCIPPSMVCWPFPWSERVSIYTCMVYELTWSFTLWKM